MDKKLQSECLALVLLLAAFPIISWGATHGGVLVWCIGLLAFIAGGVLPVLTRFMDHSGDRIRDAGVEFDERTS
jgi:hypothetical protein